MAVGLQGGTLDLGAGGGTIDVEGDSAAISSTITGACLAKMGPGLLNLAGANTNDATEIDQGTLQVGGNLAIGGSNCNLTVNGGILDLNDWSIVVASLGGYGGTITDNNTTSGSGTSTLTVDKASNSTFYGVVLDGSSRNVAIDQTGSGTVNLMGNSTTTEVDSSVDPSLVGQPIELTANVVGDGTTSDQLNGTVQFWDGGTYLGDGDLNSSGQVTFVTPSTLVAGIHIITAVYQGNDNFQGSSSQATVTIVQDEANVQVTASANPAVVGQPVTFTATLPTNATGSVTFYDGTTELYPVTVPVSEGIATLTLSSGLSQGSHAITAVYHGDANYASCTSAPLQVLAIPTTLPTFADHPSESVANDPVNLATPSPLTDGSLVLPLDDAGLNYISGSANPNPIISADAQLQPTDGGGSALEDVEVSLTVNGVSSGTTYYSATGVESSTPYRFAEQVNASGLSSGCYTWTMTVKEEYEDGNSINVYPSPTGYVNILNRSAGQNPFCPTAPGCGAFRAGLPGTRAGRGRDPRAKRRHDGALHLQRLLRRQPLLLVPDRRPVCVHDADLYL